jgi:Outer membrane protein beta-barrel domain
MKKALLSAVVFIAITTIAQAQIRKGSVLLGGNVGFGNSKNVTNPTKQTNVFVNPAFGVAVKENLVAGIDVTYNHSETMNNSQDYSTENTTAGSGFFLRRYIPVVKNLYLYGQGSLYYSRGTSKQRGIDYKQDITSNATGLRITPGLAYALSKKFHLELGFNDLLGITYEDTKTERVSSGTSSTLNGHVFGFNTGLSTSAPFYVGFRIFLSK